MKVINRIAIISICLSLLSACTESTNIEPAPTISPTEKLETANTTKETEIASEGEIEGELILEDDEITTILKQALAAMEKVDKVELYLEMSDDYSYYEGKDYMSLMYNTLTMQRNPDIAREYVYRSSYYYDGYDVTDDSTTEYEYYYSKEDGLLYYSQYGDNEWFSDYLWDGYKTIGTLEDIISFFLAYSDYTELYFEPVEGGEVPTDEVAEYRRIQLNLPIEKFIESTPKLTRYFFHPEIDVDNDFDQTYIIYSEELSNYAVSIILDEHDRLIEYDVTFETTDYDNSMYRVNSSNVMNLMYEDSIETSDIVISDEIKTMAEANSQ